MQHEQDNFTTFDAVGNRTKNSNNAANLVSTAALRLAIRFTEKSDIPESCWRKPVSAGKTKKTREDSGVEKRFRENVNQWEKLIEVMLTKIDTPLAERFIELSPRIEGRLQSVTDCEDFCRLIEYLILRRDREGCDANELGWLACLSVAFQREIENAIQPRE
jgi:hypothetical protein